jgi:hypothetical protein
MDILKKNNDNINLLKIRDRLWLVSKIEWNYFDDIKLINFYLFNL